MVDSVAEIPERTSTPKQTIINHKDNFQRIPSLCKIYFTQVILVERYNRRTWNSQRIFNLRFYVQFRTNTVVLSTIVTDLTVPHITR